MSGVRLFSDAGARACANYEPRRQPPEPVEDHCGCTVTVERGVLAGRTFGLLRDECDRHGGRS